MINNGRRIGDLLKQGNQIAQRADLVVAKQHVRVFQHGLHPLRIGDEVGGYEATVESCPRRRPAWLPWSSEPLPQKSRRRRRPSRGRRLRSLSGVIVGRNGRDLGLLGFRLDGTRHRMKRRNRGVRGPVEPALEIDGAGARHDVANAVGKIAWARMVEVLVPSPTTSPVLSAAWRSTWAPRFSSASLRSNSLAMVTPSLRTDRCAPALLNQNRFRFRAQRDADRIGKQRRSAQDFFAGGGVKQDLLVGHDRLFVLVVQSNPAASSPAIDTARALVLSISRLRESSSASSQGLGRLRKGDGQDAVLEAEFDLLGVDAARYLQRAPERAVATFGHVTMLGFLVLFFPLFALTVSMPLASRTSISLTSRPGNSTVTSNAVSFSTISIAGVTLKPKSRRQNASTSDSGRNSGACRNPPWKS